MLAPILASAALMAALAGEPAQDDHFRLDNGLEVILRPDPRIPMIAVRVRYHVGSVDDPSGRGGLAHIVEHLAYEGSRHIARDVRQAFEYRLSAHANNAETGYFSTEYYWTAPAQAFEHLLWFESDRMGFVRGQHGATTLAGVRKIVRNERRERAEQDPFARLEVQAIAALFPAGHPYHGAVIGSGSEIEAATIADVDGFMGRWYGPHNATLVLVGDLPADARALVERYFGALPGGARPALRTVPTIERTTELRIAAEQPIGAAAAVFLAWPSPALDADGDAAADVLADVLERGGHLRLARDGGTQVAALHAGQQSHPGQSIFMLRAIGRAGATPEKLIAEIDRVLARVAAGELDDAAIRQARARLARELATAGQDLQTRAELAAAAAAVGKREDLDREQWLGVTGADVARLAREVLTPQRRVAVLAQGDE